MLPSSPNWYCYRVSDCSLHSVYAFGAKNDIVLLDVAARQFVGVLSGGHSNRVTGLEWCKYVPFAEFHGYLVSCSDDKTVAIWDTKQQTRIKHHNVHQVRLLINNVHR